MRASVDRPIFFGTVADSDEVRLAEVLTALSLATDLGMGQPIENALRTALIAVRLGERLDCDAPTLSDIYYLALLLHLGCTAHAHEMAQWVGGDEIAYRAEGILFPSASLGYVMSNMVRLVGRDRPLPARAWLVAAMLTQGAGRFRQLAAIQCEGGAILARRLQLGEGVAAGLLQALERWDGKGVPQQLKGDQLCLPIRIVQVAQDANIFERMRGAERCMVEIKARRGDAYDPSVADALVEHLGDLLVQSSDEFDGSLALEAEPQPRRMVPESGIDDLARVFADFTDLKSPFLSGHSTGVARLAELAADAAGLSNVELLAVRRAGLLDDTGRLGVPNGIWDKPGALTSAQWERVRLHPYYTERILRGSGPLRALSELAGAHHERVDGAGYHRGSAGATLSQGARLLAAADAYQAMTQPRPHRPALAPDAAASELRLAVTAGRLDRRAATAVLEAAGHPPATRGEYPAGLTEREVEVLALMCRGNTNKSIGLQLFVSDRTVGHHIAHIYNKIGFSTRAGATLFAMEHDLLS